MKPSTRQLIESFRYRRLAYLSRSYVYGRIKQASTLKKIRCLYGEKHAVKIEIAALDYRKHLASYVGLKTTVDV